MDETVLSLAGVLFVLVIFLWFELSDLRKRVAKLEKGKSAKGKKNKGYFLGASTTYFCN